jgi:hypothetical protein
MATCDLPTPKVGLLSSAALHQLKNLVQHDPAFAQALQATTSTAAAARLAAAHGIPVMRAAHLARLRRLSWSNQPHPGGSLQPAAEAWWRTPLRSPPWLSAASDPQQIR